MYGFYCNFILAFYSILVFYNTDVNFFFFKLQYLKIVSFWTEKFKPLKS